MFLTSSDFVGKYKIAKDCYSKVDLEYYIEKYEKKYLKEMLGCDLYDLFALDLNNDDVPKSQTTRFIDIYDEFCVEDVCGVTYSSDGILEMLKGFIYYEYILDQKFKNTISGTVVNETAFSREVSLNKSNILDRYNSSVDTYTSIQLFMMDNKTIYPEFKGSKKRKSYFGGGF